MLTAEGDPVRATMHPQRSFADVEYDGPAPDAAGALSAAHGGADAVGAARSAHPPGLPHRRARSAPVSAGPAAADSLRATYNLSDPAMEDALYDSVAVQRFVGLTARDPRPDETTILNFRHLLERHQLGEGLLAEITQQLAAQGLRLREGTIVDATILDAPASTKNRAQARDPEMHQVKKGNQWYFGMKAHIGGGRGHGTGAQPGDDGGQRGGYLPRLLHGAETRVWGDAGYAGVARRPEHQGRRVDWQVALRPGQRRRLAPGSAAAQADNARPRFERRWSIHFSM